VPQNRPARQYLNQEQDPLVILKPDPELSGHFDSIGGRTSHLKISQCKALIASRELNSEFSLQTSLLPFQARLVTSKARQSSCGICQNLRTTPDLFGIVGKSFDMDWRKTWCEVLHYGINRDSLHLKASVSFATQIAAMFETHMGF
jgi:hypothetical protein